MIANDLIAWSRWAADGKTDAERRARLDRIQRFVFPGDLTELEQKRREELVEYVKKMGEPPSWDGFPDAEEIPDGEQAEDPDALPVFQRSTWQGLVPAGRPAYRRGSLHDGTALEVARARDFARGSPFDADYDARPKAPTPPARRPKAR